MPDELRRCLPSLTVAISTHDGHKRFLPRAIASALGAEVLVIDNGWECHNDIPEGVRYFGREPTGPGGQVASRLIALSEATGDYILHLDADDWLLSLPEPSGDWFYSDLFLCDEEDCITERWDYSPFPRTRADAEAFALARASNPTPMKACFRREWLEAEGLGWYAFPHATWADDMRTALEYHRHAPEVVYSPESPFYVYRTHAAQQSCLRDRAVLRADTEAYLKGE